MAPRMNSLNIDPRGRGVPAITECNGLQVPSEPTLAAKKLTSGAIVVNCLSTSDHEWGTLLAAGLKKRLAMSPAPSTPSWTEYRLGPIWTSATSEIGRASCRERV